MIGKALTEPYVKLGTQERLAEITERDCVSPTDNTEGVSYGDAYMMAAMYQSMGNDL